MIDIKLVRENPDLIKKICKDKFVEIDVDKFLLLDEKLRRLKKQIDDLNQQSNDAARSQNFELGKKLKKATILLKEKHTKIKVEFDEMLLKFPNPYSEDTPYGKDDSENMVLKKW